jgi:hypothetical protein
MGSLFKKGTPVVPVVNPNEAEHRRQLAEGVNRALIGLLNNINTASLKKGVVSTTISDQRAGPDSLILPMPTSVDGATALTLWRVSTQTDGSFVMTHVSTSTSDATIKYAIFG